MNKAELINAISEKGGLTKKASEQAIDLVFEAITEGMKSDGKVGLVGFGSFEVKERAARTGRNPRTKEVIRISASKVPVFKPGKALKDAING